MLVTWTIVEGPLMAFTLGIVLAAVAIALLSEYRRLFMADPKSVMSVEVLMQVVTNSGGPGYFAAFLIAGSFLSFACAIITLLLNLSQFIGS